MSEIQKELVKAKTQEDNGNFERAAGSYFKAAQLAQDRKLYNKAFFTSRKSANPNLMFQIGKEYYNILAEEGQLDKVKELLPTFIEITGRIRDQLQNQPITEELVEVLNWSIDLYTETNHPETAYEYSHEAGDAFSKLGTQILESSYLIGKEEKWQKGLDHFQNAIDSYQKIRLDAKSIERILNVRILKIDKLIDIERVTEGIEEADAIIKFFDNQSTDILPYTKKELSENIAEVFANKSIAEAEAKHYKIAEALQTTANAFYRSAGKYTSITPFTWKLAQIFDKHNQVNNFLNLTESAFSSSISYKDTQITEEILTYITGRGFEECNNALSSRMLMVKKGSIEFQNSIGIHYLMKAMALAQQAENRNVPTKIVGFLFDYAKQMFEKKLRIRALPYLEFCAHIYWDLLKSPGDFKNVTEFIDSNYRFLLSDGKFDDASKYLETLLSIKSFTGDYTEVGNLAFSFAQVALQQSKDKIELTFLEHAIEAYSKIEAKNKLTEMLEYIKNRYSPLFTSEARNEAPRKTFTQLGKKIAGAISKESQGNFLKFTTINALENGLVDFSLVTAEEAFNIICEYSPIEAIDLYFHVGSNLIDFNLEKSLELISCSTEMANNFENTKSLLDRNLTFLKNQVLESDELIVKIKLVNKLDAVSEIVDRQDDFNQFLLLFTRNLAENCQNPDYFVQFRTFLDRSFSVFYSQNHNHPCLIEQSSWLKDYIISSYSILHSSQLFELIYILFGFYEKLEISEEVIPFFWSLFENFISIDDFKSAIELYKKVNGLIMNLNVPELVRKEVTEQVVEKLDRNVKPLIRDEKFDNAFPILDALFSVLEESDLKVRAIELFSENAPLFAKERLDLALAMWSQAAELAKSIQASDQIEKILNYIMDAVIPEYTNRGIPQAVSQLNQQAAILAEMVENKEKELELILTIMKSQLGISDFEQLLEWGRRGFNLSVTAKNENILFEFSNMFFAVGRGLLQESPEIAQELLNTASNALRRYGDTGYDYYCVKMAEIYGDLYNTPETTDFAQKERENILKHFKNTNKRLEEAKFYLTFSKIAFSSDNFNEGFNLIQKATDIFMEIQDADGLSEVVSLCLKLATQYSLESSEYNILNKHITRIQEGNIKISEEVTQEAFGDLFDGMLDEMTALMDPSKRKAKEKQKQKKKGRF